jgi:hypothetical protein
MGIRDITATEDHSKAEVLMGTNPLNPGFIIRFL